MITRWLKRFEPLQWGYLIGLGLPATVLLVLLKCWRLLESQTSAGLWGWVDLVRSELFFGLVLAAVGTVVLGAGAREWPRRVTLVTLQLAAGILIFIELAGHQFFLATGSILDFHLVQFALENLDETRKVLASEIPAGFIGLVSISLLWCLTVPWLVAWLMDRRRGEQPRDGINAASPVLLVAALVFLAVAATPPLAANANTSANGRVTTVKMVSSAVSALSEASAEPDSVAAHALDVELEPTEASTEAPKNVVYVLLESTRARSVGHYNPDLDTTPFFDRLAKESTVAERAYAVVPHTSKALVAMLCGSEPRLNMPITESVPGNIPARCLADLLDEEGYRTAFFQSAIAGFEGREQLVDNMGYEFFQSVEDMDTEGFEKANYFGREDNVMLEPSRQWLESIEDEPFFATYLTLTPHHDYLAPRTYGRHDFADDGKLNRYQNSVHYLDGFLERLFEQYKELGLYEDTLFVIAGDHGEGFGEHGRHQHDNVIYEEGLRVPLLIHDPTNRTPRSIDENVSHLDLLPTTVRWLGFELEGKMWGEDIRRLDEQRPIRAHCWYERRCMAQIDGDQKYIHHFGSQPDEFYDLGDDPLEQDNLAGKRDDLDRWREDLTSWRRRINAMHREHAEKGLDRFLSDEPPEVEHRVDVRIGDVARLVGYDVDDQPVEPGETIDATLYFESLAPIEEGWSIFVHTEGAGPVKPHKHSALNGLYPVHEWEPGTFITDPLEVRVPGSYTSGHVELFVGIWHPDKGRKSATGDADIEENRIKIATIPVEADDDSDSD